MKNNTDLFEFSTNYAKDIKSKASNLLRRRHTEASINEKGLLASREDILKWQTSFDALLRHKYGIALFRGFLKTEFSDENIEFWLECEDYKYTNKELKRHAKAKKIYADFVQAGAPHEVNVEVNIRVLTAQNILAPSFDSFDRAQKRIQVLMEKDSYPRFLESDLYKNLLASFPTPPRASPPSSKASSNSKDSTTNNNNENNNNQKTTTSDDNKNESTSTTNSTNNNNSLGQKNNSKNASSNQLKVIQNESTSHNSSSSGASSTHSHTSSQSSNCDQLQHNLNTTNLQNVSINNSSSASNTSSSHSNLEQQNTNNNSSNTNHLSSNSNSNKNSFLSKKTKSFSVKIKK